MLSITVSEPRKEGKGLSAKTTYLITTIMPIQASEVSLGDLKDSMRVPSEESRQNQQQSDSMSTKNQPSSPDCAHNAPLTNSSHTTSPHHVQTFTIRRRYSEFLRAYVQWKQEYPILPALPPKTTLKRFSDATVQHRLEAFNRILRKALQVPKLREMKEFQEFLGIDALPGLDDNEPWYPGDASAFQSCVTDDDLKRICNNYRKNKPELADLLGGLTFMRIKCHHLGDLLKVMQEGSEEERKNLVRWAVLRLQDLPTSTDDTKVLNQRKESIVKYVKYYEEKQWIEKMVDRAMELIQMEGSGAASNEQENHVTTEQEAADAANAAQESLQSSQNQESESTDQCNTDSSPNRAASSGQDSQTDTTRQNGDDSQAISSSHGLSIEIDTAESTSPPKRPPSMVASSINNSSSDSLSVSPLPPARPRTPPPFRGSICSFSSDISDIIKAMDSSSPLQKQPSHNQPEGASATNGSASDDVKIPRAKKPLPDLPAPNKRLSQVDFMQLFSSLQSEEETIEAKMEIVKKFVNSSEAMTCEQLQFILGSFPNDEERHQVLELVEVSDPENYMAIEGYSSEFTKRAHEFLKQQVSVGGEE